MTKSITVDVDLMKPQDSLVKMDSAHDAVMQTHNIFLVPDLHGHYIKLLSVLLHLERIRYKNNPRNDNQDIHNLVQTAFELRNAMYAANIPLNGYAARKFIIDFLNEKFVRNIPCKHIACNHAECKRWRGKVMIFFGDTHCDRGPSDFISFCIFIWMFDGGVIFFILLGNHELRVWEGEAFTQEPNPQFFHTRPDKLPPRNLSYFQSFDYFKIDPNCRKVFREMYLRVFERTVFLAVFFEKDSQDPILLTHAPASRAKFADLTRFYEKLTGIREFEESLFTFSDSYAQQNYLNYFVRSQILLPILKSGLAGLSPLHSLFLKSMADFCFNREISSRDPFFDSQPFSYSGVGVKLRRGMNIFGHMGGTLVMEGNQINRKRPNWPETYVCLDTPTGMRSDLMEGPVRYGFLNT